MQISSFNIQQSKILLILKIYDRSMAKKKYPELGFTKANFHRIKTLRILNVSTFVKKIVILIFLSIDVIDSKCVSYKR